MFWSAYISAKVSRLMICSFTFEYRMEEPPVDTVSVEPHWMLRWCGPGAPCVTSMDTQSMPPEAARV